MESKYIAALLFAIAYLVFIYIIRNIKTYSDFTVGGRNIGFLIIFSSLAATIIGPGFSMGFVKEGYKSGFLFSLLSIAYTFQMVVTGIFLIPRLRKQFTTAHSIGDVVAGEQSHNNPLLKKVIGVFSFLICVGVSSVLCRASGEVLNNFLGISVVTGGIIVTSIVTVYCLIGGIKASIYADSFQFFTFVIIVPLLFFASFSEVDFTSYMKEGISLTSNSFHNTTGMQIFSLLFILCVGDILQPPLLNRVLASKDEQVSRRAYIATGIFCFFWLILMNGLGIMPHFINGLYPQSDQLLINLGEHFYTNFIYGFFVMGILSIIMSSQDSLINAASIVFTNDIVSKKTLGFTKISTLLSGILAICLSNFIPEILSAILTLGTIWAPTMLVIILSSIYLKKHFALSAYLSFSFGLISSLALLKINNEFLPPIIIGLLISFLAYFITHYYKLKTEKTI